MRHASSTILVGHVVHNMPDFVTSHENKHADWSLTIAANADVYYMAAKLHNENHRQNHDENPGCY